MSSGIQNRRKKPKELSAKDRLYQEAVDKEADKILQLTVDEFLKIADYGSIEAIINGKKVSMGWWHLKLSENLHHVVFGTNRTFLCFYHPYFSGVKLEDGKMLKMSDDELGAYD